MDSQSLHGEEMQRKSGSVQACRRFHATLKSIVSRRLGAGGNQQRCPYIMENRGDLGELFLSVNGMNAARRPLGEGIRGDSSAIVGLRKKVGSRTLVADCLVSRPGRAS